MPDFENIGVQLAADTDLDGDADSSNFEDRVLDGGFDGENGDAAAESIKARVRLRLCIPDTSLIWTRQSSQQLSGKACQKATC